MYKEKSYMDIFEQLKAKNCKFKAHADDYFLTSLCWDEYDGWQMLTSQRKIDSLYPEQRMGLTSIANTGFIYYEYGDCFYNISIYYADDTTNEYDVTITYCPMTIIQDESGETKKVLI